jgi:isopenicillin N synthase-like dioxygenase
VIWKKELKIKKIKMSREISKNEVLKIDFNELNNSFKLKKSLIDQGYLFIKNHPIDISVYNKCMSHLINFFSQNKAYKYEYLYNGIDQKEYGNIGYFPFSSETAIDSNVPDIKEFFHIGPINILNLNVYPKNKWPKYFSEFEEDFKELYRQYDNTAKTIVKAILRLYNIRDKRISELIAGDNSILRLINYPKIENDEIGNRASEHTGINLIGIQICPSQPGLEIYTKNKEWIRINKKVWNANLVINIGEMLPIILNDENVKATLHRVSNPDLKSKNNVNRQSMVYFYHANPYSQLNSHLNAGKCFKERLKDISSEQK